MNKDFIFHFILIKSKTRPSFLLQYYTTFTCCRKFNDVSVLGLLNKKDNKKMKECQI